jgi:hypothetical protein
MNVKRMLCASTLAAGIGAAGLFGIATGTASADPGQPCGAPNVPACQGGPQQGGPQQGGPQQGGPQQGGPQQGGPVPAQNNQRGIDQGRQDHQPFTYNGQQVTPMQAGNGAGWGFWLGGLWIPL